MSILSKIQQQTADKIISIGHSMGKNETQIRTAVKVAFIETSLDGTKKNTAGMSATGLYQYMDGSWPKNSGNRLNDNDSIHMFYKDMQKFDNNYADHLYARQNDPVGYTKKPLDQQMPVNITREEYIYVKHHDGASANGAFFHRDSNMNKGINIYNQKILGPSGANAVTDEAIKNHTPTNTTGTPSTTTPKPQASLLDYYAKGVGEVHVSAYDRSTGNVHEHYRSHPDGSIGNNLSTNHHSGAGHTAGFREPTEEEKKRMPKGTHVLY